MRPRSSMLATSFYPSSAPRNIPSYSWTCSSLILSALYPVRPIIFFITTALELWPYLFLEASLPRMTLENQRERDQGRLFSSLLLTDSGSFFLFLACALMISFLPGRSPAFSLLFPFPHPPGERIFSPSCAKASWPATIARRAFFCPLYHRACNPDHFGPFGEDLHSSCRSG